MQSKNNTTIVDWEDVKKDEKFETKELILKHGDKTLKANIQMDFKLFVKCESLFMNMKADDGSPSMSMSLSTVGDKLLFYGWHSGDESIRGSFKLRTRATHILGKWFLDQMPQEEDEQPIDQKKN